MAEGEKLPLDHAERFEVYRPSSLALAVGDRIRVTAGGKSKDGKHRLANGALLNVQGFNRQGDPIVDHGWVIGKDWGHLALGYAVTSHASQGSTVDKVFIGQSSQSFPASNRRQFYVSISRGKKQAVVFTDHKKELLKAVKRADEPMSAMELAASRPGKPPLFQRLKKHLAFMRRLGNFGRVQVRRPAEPHRPQALQREVAYER